jgi:outer membrane lipoprotein SlyB
MRRTSLSLGLSVLLLAGCASQTGWQPTVDYRGERPVETVQRDYYECRGLAQRASGGTGTETAKGAVVGGLIGAAAGAAIGAAAGNPGAGAAIGAATGGIGGGTVQGVRAEEQYKRAYANCMAGRGHRVIN